MISKKGHLYMNGRGQSFPQWNIYILEKHGHSVKSPLLDDEHP